MAETKKQSTAGQNLNTINEESIKELYNICKSLKEEINKKNATIEELEKKLSKSEEKTTETKETTVLKADLQDLINEVASNTKETTTVANANIFDDITFIHLADRGEGLTTHLETPSGSVDLHSFGEEITVTRTQAQEIAGRYRRWIMDYNILTLGADEASQKFAKRLKLKTILDYPSIISTNDFIETLGTCSVDQLRKIYNQLDDKHKEFVVSYFERKYDEKDPRFMDMVKIRALNEESNGKLKNFVVAVETEKIKNSK